MDKRKAKPFSLARDTLLHIGTEGSVYAVCFFSAPTFAAAVEAARDGSALATAQVKAVRDMLATIETCDTPGDAPKCLFCDKPFWKGHSPKLVGVMHTLCDVPTDVVTHVVCHNCEEGHSTVAGFNRAVAARFQHIGADVRVLPPLSAGGHA